MKLIKTLLLLCIFSTASANKIQGPTLYFDQDKIQHTHFYKAFNQKKRELWENICDQREKLKKESSRRAIHMPDETKIIRERYNADLKKLGNPHSWDNYKLICAKIAARRGAHAVAAYSNDSHLYVDPAYDITEEVAQEIEKLNPYKLDALELQCQK